MELACLDTLLAFKSWADQQTLTAIAAVDTAQYADQQRIMVRLMNHIYVVDRIFQGNLLGKDHGYRALNTVETPTIAELSLSMQACSEWYRDYVSANWNPAQKIAFTFVAGGQGIMSAAEMVHHSLHHSSYHRGAVGWLITQAGGQPPQDALTVFLRDVAPTGSVLPQAG